MKSSNLLLAVMGYKGTHEAAARHLPYWQIAGADKILGVGTTDGTKWPDGVEPVSIGRNAYIEGPHLPQRLMDTMRLMLLMPYERFLIIEWDCLFFKPMVEFNGMVGFHAGNQLEGMRTKKFFHCPWGFDFDAGMNFLTKADELLPQVSGHECSPDVFFGWVCQEAGIEVTQPWSGFTRNTIETAADAEAARIARLNGAMAVHGVKTRTTLDYIMA